MRDMFENDRNLSIRKVSETLDLSTATLYRVSRQILLFFFLTNSITIKLCWKVKRKSELNLRSIVKRIQLDTMNSYPASYSLMNAFSGSMQF